MEWMILPLKKYFQFSGRSRRKEYWMWVLFVFVVYVVLSIIDSALGLGGRSSFGPSGGANPYGSGAGVGAFVSGGVLASIFALATLVPGVAVSVRRLHDIDRTGWWILAPVLPYLLGAILLVAGAMGGGGALAILGGIAMFVGFVTAIVLLVWYCMNGTKGPNRFGEDPKEDSVETLADTFA
ncbi:uncharacterized membrane protein YhaH (DUF805 family) [Sphingomonas sp. UYAg733]